MIDFDKKTKLILLTGFCLYIIAAIWGGIVSGLYFFSYIMLPSCYTFFLFFIGGKTGKILSALTFAVTLSIGGYLSLIFGIFYALIALAVNYSFTIDVSEFKKFSLTIMVTLLLMIGSFVLLDFMYSGPSFIEEINSLIKNATLIEELSNLVANNTRGGENIIIDQDVLKLAITTLLPLFLLFAAIIISSVNYVLSNLIRSSVDRAVKRVRPLWKLYVPKPLISVLVLGGFLGAIIPGTQSGFGSGIFISSFMLNSVLFVTQGIFLMSHLMLIYGIKPKIITPVVLLIIFLALLLNLRAVFTALLFGGLADLLFDIRKLNKRGL